MTRIDPFPETIPVPEQAGRGNAPQNNNCDPIETSQHSPIQPKPDPHHVFRPSPPPQKGEKNPPHNDNNNKAHLRLVRAEQHRYLQHQPPSRPDHRRQYSSTRPYSAPLMDDHWSYQWLCVPRKASRRPLPLLDQRWT